MEPYVVPFHSSSPPPLDDYGGVDAGSEDEEFGDFGGFPVIVSCSSSHLPKSKISPGSLRESSNSPVDQPKSLSSVPGSCREQVNMKGQSFMDDLSSHLTNGYAKGDRRFGPCDAFQVESFSSKEDDGFADFSVFAEQAAHPWCCGFSPLATTEQRAPQVEGTDPGERVCDVIMDSEPRSYDNVCTNINHCERRCAAVVKPSQDQRQPQEAAAGLECEEPEDVEEQRERCGDFRCDKSLTNSEVEENEDAEKKTGTSVYDSASEDLASLCDDFSFDGVSADMEPNVSSLASHDDQTDWDQTDDEGDELGHCGNPYSLDNTSMANLCQSEEEKGFHCGDQSVTQEHVATSTSSCERDSSADDDDKVSEAHSDPECEPSVGGLPPSDSFADFCSAPTEGDGDTSWAEFPGQRTREEEQPWTDGGDRSVQTDGDSEGRQDGIEECGVLRRNSCQTSFSCRVHQLLWSSFPDIGVAAVEEDVETLTLGALLFTQMPDLRLQSGLWWPNQDVTGALGLQFQWPGSHTNTTLLRCLSVNKRDKGIREPTKDSVPGNRSDTDGLPGPGTKPQPSVKQLQETLSSKQPERSSRGLTSAEDDCPAVNLDYFGCDDGEDKRPSSSNSPPPGVDRELYELTMNKLETKANSCHLEDTLNRLMSAAEKTSVSVRTPKQEEKLSSEARTMIAKLPNLSFMRASVLMFPSILVPKESSVLE